MTTIDSGDRSAVKNAIAALRAARYEAALLVGLTLLVGATAALFAQAATAPTDRLPPLPPFSAGKVFTFLFMTLGPFKIIGPFAAMTRGRDAQFKRRLAFKGIVIASIGTVVAATGGALILRRWGISTGALLLTAGVLLFLIALRPVMEQYTAPQPAPADADSVSPPEPPASKLAFSPLAFPTIVTPYGVAVLIMLATLRAHEPETLVKVLSLAGIVLALDVVAMLAADRVLASPLVRSVLGVLGAVMGVFQVALGVQAVIDALHMLGFGTVGSG